MVNFQGIIGIQNEQLKVLKAKNNKQIALIGIGEKIHNRIGITKVRVDQFDISLWKVSDFISKEYIGSCPIAKLFSIIAFILFSIIGVGLKS